MDATWKPFRQVRLGKPWQLYCKCNLQIVQLKWFASIFSVSILIDWWTHSPIIHWPMRVPSLLQIFKTAKQTYRLYEAVWFYTHYNFCFWIVDDVATSWMGEFPNCRSTKQQKMKNWSQTAEYFFMLQSDWLKFEIELNSLSWKRVSHFDGIFIIT